MTEWRHPHYPYPAVKPVSEKDAMRARFHKVILLAGYSERAAQGILEEWFEKLYNGDEEHPDPGHKNFIAMFEEYERKYAEDGEII